MIMLNTITCLLVIVTCLIVLWRCLQTAQAADIKLDRLYLTCGYCGQSVPSDDGFHVNPHKYTENISGERVDCPQGTV